MHRTMNKYALRAAIYARISHDGSHLGEGVQRQLEMCRELAEREGYSVVSEHVDNSLSAWKVGVRRPAYEEMQDAIRAGEIDVVLCYELDRLERRLEGLLPLLRLLQEQNVTVHTYKSGAIPLRSSRDIAMAQIAGVMAEQYVTSSREKNLDARARLAQQGRRHKAARVYGWNDDGETLREAEAEIVREIVQRLIDGERPTGIARSLNARDIPTVRGARWTGIGVRKCATRPSNAGVRSHHENEYDGTWQPIISKDTRERLLRALKHSESMKHKRGAGRKYLLTGFAVCGECGNKMGVGAARSNHKSAYRCDSTSSEDHVHKGCGRVTRNAEPLEALVTEYVLFRLESDGLRTAIEQSHASEEAVQQLVVERDDQQARLNELVDDYSTGVLDKQQFVRAKQIATGRLEEIQRKLDTATYSTHLGAIDLHANLAETWQTATLEWRRQVLDLLIDEVVIHKAPKKGYKWQYYKGQRFDPSLIEVKWKL